MGYVLFYNLIHKIKLNIRMERWKKIKKFFVSFKILMFIIYEYGFRCFMVFKLKLQYAHEFYV